MLRITLQLYALIFSYRETPMATDWLLPSPRPHSATSDIPGLFIPIIAWSLENLRQQGFFNKVPEKNPIHKTGEMVEIYRNIPHDSGVE